MRAFLGLALIGYGLLIFIGLTVHESPWIAAVSICLGLLLVMPGLPHIQLRRRGIVLGLGLAALGGTLVYNLWRGSGLSVPEWTLVGYGSFLAAASFFLDRRIGRFEVSTLVAWSFPLLLAPLLMFSANAAFSHGGTQVALNPLVNAAVVVPTTTLLVLIGTPVELVGNNMIVSTPRGTLALGIGLVCAGLYPIILYAALLGMHAWHSSMSRGRFLLHLGAGTAVLWLLNLVRLVILTRVGIARGPEALQTTHDHIGWVLFALFITTYWGIVALRQKRRSGFTAQPD